jgi:hypothetical protein
VTEWLAALDVSVSWVLLDLSEHNPLRFFAHLIFTIQWIDPSFYEDIEIRLIGLYGS